MGGRATILGAQLARGEYVVDEHAVADAIVRRRLASRRGLRVLEPHQAFDAPAVGRDEGDALSGGDVA